MITVEELIDRTKKNAGEDFTKVAIRKVLTAYFNAIEDCLACGEDVNIDKLVRLQVVDIPERTGVNYVGNGEKWTIPAHRGVKARSGPRLKAIIPE